MLVSEAMSTPTVSVSPQCPIGEAATLMREHDIGALPVVSRGDLVGVVTDRDIVVRFVAGLLQTGSRPVCSAMSHNPLTCYEDQTVTEAAVLMGDAQVRRLMVLDRSWALVGILSVDDIAENVSEELAGQALGEIVERR